MQIGTFLCFLGIL